MKKIVLVILIVIISSSCNTLKLSTFTPATDSIFSETNDFEFVESEDLPQPEVFRNIGEAKFVLWDAKSFQGKGKLELKYTSEEIIAKDIYDGSFILSSYPYGWEFLNNISDNYEMHINTLKETTEYKKYHGKHIELIKKEKIHKFHSPIIFYDPEKDIYINKVDIKPDNDAKGITATSELQCKSFVDDSTIWKMDITNKTIVNYLIDNSFIIYDEDKLFLFDAATGKPKWGTKPKEKRFYILGVFSSAKNNVWIHICDKERSDRYQSPHSPVKNQFYLMRPETIEIVRVKFTDEFVAVKEYGSYLCFLSNSRKTLTVIDKNGIIKKYESGKYLDNSTFELMEYAIGINNKMPDFTWTEYQWYRNRPLIFNPFPINDTNQNQQNFAQELGEQHNKERMLYYVYTDSKTVYGIDLETGQRTWWIDKLQYNIKTPFKINFSPYEVCLYDYNRVYIFK